jgi:hypothetical protein
VNPDCTQRESEGPRAALAHRPTAARSIARTVAIAAVVSAAFALPAVPATPSGAEPAAATCELSLALLCAMFPMFPNLDHDVDLTQTPDGLDRLVMLAPVPTSPPDEDPPPTGRTVDPDQ